MEPAHEEINKLSLSPSLSPGFPSSFSLHLRFDQFLTLLLSSLLIAPRLLASHFLPPSPLLPVCPELHGCLGFLYLLSSLFSPPLNSFLLQ